MIEVTFNVRNIYGNVTPTPVFAHSVDDAWYELIAAMYRIGKIGNLRGVEIESIRKL